MVDYPGIVASSFSAPASTPLFIGAGIGNAQSVDTTDLAPGYPASPQSGDKFYLQVYVRDIAGAVATPSGWTPEFDPTTDGDENATFRQWIFSKTAVGTESGTQAVDWTGSAANVSAAARIYLSRGVSSITSAALEVSSGGVTSIAMPTVVAGGNNRLAVAFLCLNLARTVGEATGETGGDWTEAVAEYTEALNGGGGTLQLQTADMSGGGTITGGSTTFSGSPRALVRAFALVP